MDASYSWSNIGNRPNLNQSTNNNLSEFRPGGVQQQQQLSTGVSGQMPTVAEQIQKIKTSFDPQNPKCEFQHYFYNKVPGDQALLYTKPERDDQERWNEAISNRPDASSIPVLAVGFNDLRKRVDLQQQQINGYRGMMNEINTKLDLLNTSHDLNSSVKLVKIKTLHRKLVHRTLVLARKIEVIRNRGYNFRNDEEVLNKTLLNLVNQIHNPALFGQDSELWAKLATLRERVGNPDPQNEPRDPPALDWERDDEQLEKLSQILKSQQTAISYLANLIIKDSQELEKFVDSRA